MEWSTALSTTEGLASYLQRIFLDKGTEIQAVTKHIHHLHATVYNGDKMRSYVSVCRSRSDTALQHNLLSYAPRAIWVLDMSNISYQLGKLLTSYLVSFWYHICFVFGIILVH